MPDGEYHNEILTEAEKGLMCVDLERITEVLNGIDIVSVTCSADENNLRQLLSGLPFLTKKLASIKEKLATTTKIA